MSKSLQEAILLLVVGAFMALYAWDCWRNGEIFFRPDNLRREVNPVMFPLVVAFAGGLAALMLVCGAALLFHW